MFRFANYVFGTEVESNSDNENIDLNQCIEQDIDDDWILIDVHSDDNKLINAKDVDGLPSYANYETTINRVPQTLNTSDAQQVNDCSEDTINNNTPNGGQVMEESWFVTPPPCFNSLSQPIMIETTPLENLLIEHPSMSVFGPSLPPIDRRSYHTHSSTLLPTELSSNGSTPPQSRRQMRQLRRQQQQQLIIQNRSDNQFNVNLHLRSVVLNDMQVLNEIQTKEVSQIKKVLTKSAMDRHNKVLVQRNRPENRRTKMVVRPNDNFNPKDY